MAAPGWLVYGTKLKTREQMRLDVFEYIETWYNHKRRFSALGNLTIDEFWNQYNLESASKNVKKSGSPVKKEFQGLPDKKFFTYSGEKIQLHVQS